jgi:hypothetical protein
MPRFWAVLIMALLFVSLPAAAQNLVSPKLLPSPAELRLATMNASLGQDSSAAPVPVQATPQKHWTKGGKIMTYIGLGLLGGGTAAFAYGETSGNGYGCTSGGPCVAVDWKWTGVGWMAAGSTLTIIGLTRHSTD